MIQHKLVSFRIFHGLHCGHLGYANNMKWRRNFNSFLKNVGTVSDQFSMNLTYWPEEGQAISNDSTLTESVLKGEDSGLPSCQSTAFIDTAISISNLLTVINSAANFLVYMLRGKKFRDLFLQTYFRKCICMSQEKRCRVLGEGVSKSPCLHIL